MKQNLLEYAVSNIENMQFEGYKNVLERVPYLSDMVQKISKRWPAAGRGIEDLPVMRILRERYDEQNQLKLMKYMVRVQEAAGRKMLEDESFAKLFLDNDVFNTVILSLDIRRSTELMLRAETPQIYAEFINVLTSELTESVKNRFGIYDKFTGDGLLAFFPDFYSGSDALLYALLCADDCHRIFDAVFAQYREKFAIGTVETGLGIGIDAGSVFKAGVELEYTVVGAPVVYACRFSAAPAGHTYLTERTAKMLQPPAADTFTITPARIEVKHEGIAEAYDVKPVSEDAAAKLPVVLPPWCTELDDTAR